LPLNIAVNNTHRVKYAIDTETNQAVAIKILDKEKIQKQNMGNQIKKEISIMKMVKHKYIVGMIEVLASKTKIFIVLDLVTGGELFDKIVQVGKLSEEQARFYFQQLVEGVEYCHKLGVCHRDLKPEVSETRSPHATRLRTKKTVC
jgi:serine/threonine protein kinase